MAAFFFRSQNDFGRIRVGDVVLVDPERFPAPGSAVLVWPSWRIAAAESVPPDSIIGTIASLYINGRAPAVLAGFFTRDHILTTDVWEQWGSQHHFRKN
jgi:hypothetical protein